MTTTTRRPLGVAVAGFGWMGRVHAEAYTRVLHHFPQLPLAPELVAVADDVPGRADEAAAQFGFTTAIRDWRELAADPRVAAVSIAAPNFPHREIGVHTSRPQIPPVVARSASRWPARASTSGSRSRWASPRTMPGPSPTR